MKHLLLTTIAAVALVGCGPSVDIHEAVEKGNIEAVKEYLDAGGDVDAKGDVSLGGGATPLLWAAWGGHKEIVELLISKGADVNTKADDGTTPLDMANAVKPNPFIIDLIRKHGGKTEEELEAAGN